MANEKRLIYANDPLKQLSDYIEKLDCFDDYRDGLYRGKEIAESYIKNAPTVDAVEVVRCKDCKYFRKGKPFRHGCKKVCGGMFYPNPDDFCSYGERRNNE